MSTPRLIYLHGFLSSPLSAKAQQLGRYLAEREPELEYVVPALPEQPQLALAAAGHAVAQALADGRVPALIGSSMGGFYATVLAERHALRTVLINPSVRPQLRLAAYFGENRNPYSGHRFVLDETDAAALTEMAPRVLARPANYWLLAQSGDEVARLPRGGGILCGRPPDHRVRRRPPVSRLRTASARYRGVPSLNFFGGQAWRTRFFRIGETGMANNSFFSPGDGYGQ